jgi:hypothetical protein
MKRLLGALVLGLAAAALATPPQVAAQGKAKPAANCKRHYGTGWAPTENMAKFQSWEITAQVTGNWPFQTDTFRNERYRCKQEGSGWRCQSSIDVCKS